MVRHVLERLAAGAGEQFNSTGPLGQGFYDPQSDRVGEQFRCIRHLAVPREIADFFHYSRFPVDRAGAAKPIARRILPFHSLIIEAPHFGHFFVLHGSPRTCPSL